MLYELVPPPRHLAPGDLQSRIKVMSNLDIAERRLPQDGRIELAIGGNQVDIRVSTLPTLFGESVVLRILDRTVVNLDLNKIGMAAGPPQDTWRTGDREAERDHPRDRADVVGQDDHALRDPERAEQDRRQDHHHRGAGRVRHRWPDPGPDQLRDRRDLRRLPAGRSSARIPDKILVGETRDLETAEISIQASLTGHIVFTTLHTNDAPSAITRLRDMGLPTFLITATVEAVLAQRLVRRRSATALPDRVHPQPRGRHGAGDDARGGVAQEVLLRQRVARSATTPATRGRMGIYELLVMNEDLREMIVLRGIARHVPRGLPQARHADPPRVGPRWPSTPAIPRSRRSCGRRCSMMPDLMPSRIIDEQCSMKDRETIDHSSSNIEHPT